MTYINNGDIHSVNKNCESIYVKDSSLVQSPNYLGTLW